MAKRAGSDAIVCQGNARHRLNEAEVQACWSRARAQVLQGWPNEAETIPLDWREGTGCGERLAQQVWLGIIAKMQALNKGVLTEPEHPWTDQEWKAWTEAPSKVTDWDEFARKLAE